MTLAEDLRSIPRRRAARRARRAAERAATGDDHWQLTRAVVEEVFAEALSSGAATLTVSEDVSPAGPGETLLVAPANPQAAQVEVGADEDATYIVVGTHHLHRELWGGLPEEREEDLRLCLEAIRDGHLEAAVERHWSGARSVLAFHAEGEPLVTYGYGVGVVGDDGSFWRETYEPY